MVGVPVKVTGSPAQIVAPVDVILTDAGTADATVIVIELDVSEAGEAQGALDVMMRVITSPLTSDDDVKVDAVAPLAFAPLICHW